MLVNHRRSDVDAFQLACEIRSAHPQDAGKLILCRPAGSDSESVPAESGPFDLVFTPPIRQTAFLVDLAGLFDESLRRETSVAPQAPQSADVETQFASRVLLVEDNRINQVLATTLLKQAGHEVDLATNGAEALEAVQREPYDVVLMDVQMPVMDGLEATRRIKALEAPHGSIPIIAMTANAMSEDRDRCLEAGMDDYLSKPIDSAVLFEKLANWSRVGKALSGSKRRPSVADDPQSKALETLIDRIDSVAARIAASRA